MGISKDAILQAAASLAAAKLQNQVHAKSQPGAGEMNEMSVAALIIESVHQVTTAIDQLEGTGGLLNVTNWHRYT